MDFMKPESRDGKRGVVEIFPSFRTTRSKDLMIRGGQFYAIWDDEKQKWSTDQDDVIRIVDSELEKYADDYRNIHPDARLRIMYMSKADTKTIDIWNHYVQKQMVDNYVPLDGRLIFSDTETSKENYSSRSLPYALEKGSIEAYEELMSTLYSPEERHKIEWSIGSVVSGDSVFIQKFLVLIGAPGTGKSTVLDIIRMLFGDYCATIDVKALTNNSSFGLEPLSNNPLVAIQDDADLSRIEDNTKLNSLVSHAIMNVNEKYKKQYDMAYHCFLFLGSNKDVDITDAQSGILRRLIDVEPTGNKVAPTRYRALMKKIKFELGGIACHCLQVYNKDPYYYDKYVPIKCFRATNLVYNCIEENIDVFNKDSVTLSEAWKLYGQFCEESNIAYKMNKTRFKTELKAYYHDFKIDYHDDSGNHMRNVYLGFRSEKLGIEKFEEEEPPSQGWIELHSNLKSHFDDICQDCLAQYSNNEGFPFRKWEHVKTELRYLDTSVLHYVRVPETHIIIDFDLKENGEKSLRRNLEEANKWPQTYVEVSKSGSGLHLHYIYTGGDPKQLSRIFSENIEVKVYTGKSALRRKLTKCNDIPIATINSGLPLKEEVKKVVNEEGLKNERAIRTCIRRNLAKEYHGATRPSIDFIFKILDDAYNNGVHYDVTDMRPAIIAFAANSTNQSSKCLEIVSKMKWKSEDSSDVDISSDETIVFYDVEVFPNLFVVVFKKQGIDHEPVSLINPTPSQIEDICKFRLVGFNNRNYDNHMMYAAMMGYNNQQLYNLSQRIIGDSPNSKFGEAYNLSYTDIYDFASAGNKMSLKKWEIKLGIHHHELGLPWDQPVPEELWDKVAEYCKDDVLATEAVFDHLKGDWTARQILADLTDSSYNDTTNQLTTRMIFGRDKNTRSELKYTKLADYFEGYKFENCKSTYRGEEVGEGGYVYAEPGLYVNVALLDIASMHPSSAIAMDIFGKYTARFKELLDARLFIKHKDWDSCRKVLDGKLAKYIDQALESGDKTVFKSISNALKTAINSVYGLTSAKFDNPFRDPRNIDNIVAKRGALFMIDLKHEVQNRGFTVAHIKTDSIKIPNATADIIEFVMEYGKKMGYTFEHEATYERMFLYDKAQYIARYDTGEWTATGTKFQIPYIFKTLFTHEDIVFDDLCETKSVKTAMYLDMNESLPEEEHNYRFVGRVGAFCPIKEGCGGGELLRDAGNGKYSAVVGTKGYRWLESEVVRGTEKEQDIDTGYFRKLVDDAINDMEQHMTNVDIFCDPESDTWTVAKNAIPF